MIKRFARWILRDEQSIFDIVLRLTERVEVCERNLKTMQRIESKCDENKRAHDILQSKYVILVNKVNGMVS